MCLPVSVLSGGIKSVGGVITLVTGACLYVSCQQALFIGGFRQAQFDKITTAKCGLNCLAILIFHVLDHDVLVATGGYKLQFVTHAELVFDIDFRDPGSFIVTQYFTDERLLPALGMAVDVVLVILSMMALEKAIGIPAVGEVFKIAE